MLKNNGKISIQRNLLFCLCVLCLIVTSFGLAMENSTAVELNTTTDEIGTQIDDGNILENSQNDEILGVDSQNDRLGEVRVPTGTTFDDIEKCIRNANDGDTIVLSGIYSANNANSQIQVNKKVTITSYSGATLDGKGQTYIMFVGKDNVVLNNLKFINSKGSWGSALYVRAKNVVMQNCLVENCHTEKGGVVSTSYNISESTNMRIENCIFRNNHAYMENFEDYASAGAVGVFGNNAQVINCEFDSNWVKGKYASYGGALQIGMDDSSYRGSVKNCVFKNNRAISILASSHGGAGCVRFGVEYANCIFINNAADEGGALTMHSSGLITNCTFIENHAIKNYGGAISSGFLYDTMVLKIIDCTFKGNDAPTGGAIQALGLDVYVVDSEFEDNHADNFGGAIYIGATDVNVENCRFKDNSAEIDGGAVYIMGKNTVISQSSFISNHAIPDLDKLDDGFGGAIYINSTEATILRNDFIYNTARNGSAIYYSKEGNDLELMNNILFQNQAWVYHLPIYTQDIYYGDSEEVKVVIYGGNNIGNYHNLAVSNAIYNDADHDKLDIDGQIPVDGAINNGQLYQDSREYNIPILLTITHEDGSFIYDKSLNSSYLGEIKVTLNDLKPGKYYVSAKHFEDTYYKGITNISSFTVYPKVDNKITITTNDTSFNFDDVVVWTIKVSNLGPNNSTGVTAYNIVPDGLILLNHTCGNRYNPKTGILNISDLAVGETLTYTMITVVNKTGEINYPVNVSSKEMDVNMTNNYDEKTIHIQPATDLSVVKTASKKEPNYLDHVTWKIVVTNNGPDEAHNVTVYDILPGNLKYVGCDGNYNNDTGIWNIGTLRNRERVTLNIDCIVIKTGVTQNNVCVNGSEFDYDLTNNRDDELIFVNSAADLKIVKTVNASHINYTDYVKWTLTVSNNGPDNATVVTITDVLPEGFKYISSTLPYVNGTIVIPKLNVGQTVTVDIVTQVNATGSYKNIANVSCDQYDYDLTNNQDDEDILIDPSCDLIVSKTVSDSEPEFNDEITWTIEVYNNGPDEAHDIIIKDLLPDTLIWYEDDSEGKYNPSTGELRLDYLDVGEGYTFNIECIVNGTGTIQNHVVVKGREHDFNLTNNEDNETIEVEKSADVSIVKLVNETNPNYQNLVKWTLIIRNNGPDKANNISIDEVLPDGLIFVSYKATKGIYREDSWIMCCLENGEEQTMEIICKVNKTGKITNEVIISADEYDYNETNNMDNETIDVPLAVDVEVIIKTNNTTPLFGEEVNWMITVKNNGPDNATGVILNEILPDELIFVDYNLTKGSYADGQWNINSLNVGETQYLNITTISNALGELVNNVNVKSYEYDWNTSNNLDDDKIEVKPVCDLSVIKLVDNAQPKYTQQVKWTIKVTNNGPNRATNVKVFESLPEGLKFIKSNGNYKNGVWNVGNLNVGESKELVITCKVTSTGNIANRISVSSDEYDSNLTNNFAEKSIIVPPASDLSITKLASKYKYAVGDVIEYVIEVVNNGPDTAKNIKVKDILDNLLKIKSFKTTMGKFNKFTLTWTIDSLGYGESAILYLKAIATGSGIIKNNVIVTSDTFDYDLSNNKDYAVVNVSDKSSQDVANGPNGLKNDLKNNPLNTLEKHKTSNPFWNLVLALVFSLIFLSGNISKKR